VSESSHPPAWAAACISLGDNTHPPRSRSQADPRIDEGRKYIDRKLASSQASELSHILRGRKPNPKKSSQGRKLPDARTGSLRAASGGGVDKGEEGSNPPVHREEEGEGAIPTPNTTQYTHFYNRYRKLLFLK
jgi:hypothetical protein